MKYLPLLITLIALPGAARALTVTSPTFKEGAVLPPIHVFDGADCHGTNRSPAIAWSSAPAETRSFAVTLFDPDAQGGGGWWHWVVVDLPAKVTHLAAGAGNSAGLPAGAVTLHNDFGDTAFGGACPPPGRAHRYVLTVYALDVDHLPVSPTAGGTAVEVAAGTHTLAKSTITATYGR